jgi:GH43 family beta-xylosidase
VAVTAGLIVSLLPSGASVRATASPAPAPAATFTNPVATNRSDPYIIRSAGKYYLTSTDGCTGGYLCVWESATLTGLGSATPYPVWKIPGCPAVNCAQVWAPEIHEIGGQFYIYYTADDGPDSNHRMFVLQSTTGTPTGGYTEANTGHPHGQLTESSNLWAIDPNVFTGADGRLYATWSGWPTSGGGQQNIYLAPMSDPLHISGARVQISAPSRPWETVAARVNEGPVGFVHGGQTFISYSGSACWDPSYAVGLLTSASGNLLDPAGWVKTGPIFKYHSGVPATASFVPVQSIDGTEDWFLVHSNTNACDPGRVLRAQRLYWDTDGTPVLGYPVGDGVPLAPPSGELGSTGTPNPFQQGWGNAFGDAAEGDTAAGPRTGAWSVVSGTEAQLGSFGGTQWTQLFRAANPNFETYTVGVDLQWTATGTTSQYPKYGIYASYDDRNNYVAVFIDIKYQVLATYAVVQGTAAGWQNAPLPAGFTANAYHRLSVRKTGGTYAFSLDGVVLQNRTFSGTFPVLLNGQVGLVTEDTEANYRNLAVTNTQ